MATLDGMPAGTLDALRQQSRPDEYLVHAEAEFRGQKLLREWLSPAQLKQYAELEYFDVIGGHTKQRYRIHRGTTYNVEQMQGEGKGRITRLCFGPEGDLVTGDTMLAQKIALETNELMAVNVANVRTVPVAVYLENLGGAAGRRSVFDTVWN